MRKWKRKLILAGIVLIVFIIIYFLLYFLFHDFFVNLWWYTSLQLQPYFLLRLTYRYLIFGGVTLFFFLIFFLNFWVASRYLGTTTASVDKAAEKERKKMKNVILMFQSGSMKIYTPLSIIIAIIIAIPLYEQWENALLFFFAPSSNIADPLFGQDISFYMFSFPIFVLIQNRLLLAFSILLAGIIILYFLESRLLSKHDRRLAPGTKIHLSLIILFILLLQTWDFFLQRYGLLYTDNHQPLFYGPGYVEMIFHLPLLWAAIIFFVLASISFVVWINSRKGMKILVALTLIFLFTQVVRSYDVFPDLIQKYIVSPNELAKEEPYIANNIESTRAAMKLDQIHTQNYVVNQGKDARFEHEKLSKSFHNIPVWDRALLDKVYDQLQVIRPYYNFSGVDVDRYTIANSYQQVNLSARELTLDRLPEGARNWVNEHLQYTHGYGIVMTPAAQEGEEAMIWYLQGIPPESDYNIEITRPEIYYGEVSENYIIAPNDLGEIDHPKADTDEEVLTNYDGSGGVPIDSMFRKLIFAIHFEELNIFFSTKTNNNSRILFRRNIRERIESITPFLLLEEDPYVVLASKKMYWIQDAYTNSKWFPYAQDHDDGFNYLRNSVKIVVDAYNGSVDYYIADPEDPIVQAYKRMYPGLLKPFDEMPEELRKHIRYPKYMFDAQLKIYNRYHQEPAFFYRQEDAWESAKLNNKPMAPYYLTLDLLQPGTEEFILVQPLSPVGRDNLRALAVVRCDGENYGDMYIYSFPKGMQVFGSSQISALVDQDTTISAELTFWDQLGSKVIRGRMIILPINQKIIYIQPIYLIAEVEPKIPELKRIIVSEGTRVVMKNTLTESFAALEKEIKKRRGYPPGLPGMQSTQPAPEEGQEFDLTPEQMRQLINE